MWRVCCVFLLTICLSTASYARPTDSTKDIIRSTLLEYFTPYINASESDKNNIQNDLLNTENESKLFYPPFPRTWIERSSSETKETTTTATFDSGKLFTALTTFGAPATLPVRAVLNGAQLGYKYEHTIKYSYSKQTTLMAMTSWRQAKDPNQALPNNKPTPGLDTDLHSVIEQRSDLRNYFKVSKEYPIIAMCKYEMSLVIQKSNTNTFSFVLGSNAKGDNVVDSMSYTVYSNFFQVESNVPVQEYLHVRCGENFTETVRFLVESEFNKMVTEAFAHYHPKSECRWNPNAPKQKNGDQDCLKWFDHFNIFTVDKNATVPRCVLGREGYPVCAVRTSKQGTYCPVYATRDQITTKEPAQWLKQINPMDNAGFISYRPIYPCDQGFECRLPNGKSVESIPLNSDPRARLDQIKKASYITTCQPVLNRGGR